MAIRGKTITIGLFLLAVAVRLLLVFLIVGRDASGIYTYEHGEIAQNLLSGKGFSVRLLGTWGPTSQQAPMIPFLLAGCYWLVGVGTSAAHWLFILIQCVEGGLIALGTRRFAARVGLSASFALLAGVLSALFPPLVYAASHVQVVSSACLILVWLFDALLQLRDEPTSRNAIRSAMLMALAVLTDPILVLSGVAATIAWVVVDRFAHKEQRLNLMKSWAILVFLSLFIISPWLVRGWWVHGQPVFIKSTFGYAFWQGNNRYSVGTDKVMRASAKVNLSENTGSIALMDQRLWDARHAAGCIDDIALSQKDKKELGVLPELQRSKELFRRALADLRQEPGRYPTLCLRRLRYFLWIDESNPKTASLFYQIPQKILVIFSTIALLIMPQETRRRLLSTMIAFGLTTLFHAATITAPRFHLPWEPLMIIWISAGLQKIFVELAERHDLKLLFQRFYFHKILTTTESK
jgi:hypothetical protein